MLAKGFLDQSRKQIEAEQKKRDDLTSTLQALHLKAIQEDREEWDKREDKYKEIEKQMEANPYGAFNAMAAMDGLDGVFDIKQMKEIFGDSFGGGEGETYLTDDPNTLRSLIKDQIERHRSIGRPSYDKDSLSKFEFRRAASDDLIAGTLRKVLGIDKPLPITPNIGIKNGRVDEILKGVSTDADEAELEVAAEQIYSELDKPITTDKDRQPTTTEKSNLFVSRKTGDEEGRYKYKSTVTVGDRVLATYEDNVSGEIVVKDEGIYRPLSSIESTKLSKLDLSPDEAIIFNNLLEESKNMASEAAESDDALDNNMKEIVGMFTTERDREKGKGGDVASALLLERANQIRREAVGFDTPISLTDAYDRAYQEMRRASEYMIVRSEGRFTNRIIGLKRRFNVIPPGREEAVSIPWYRLSDALAAGGVLKR